MSAAVASVRAWAVAVPAWAWLCSTVVLSVAVRFALERRMVAPWIMVDELIYSELAKSLAAHGTYAIRGHAATGFGYLYPLLIAPAFRIASVPTAYAVAKAIGAVVMSLAAVPAYFLARRVVSVRLALLAALLTVAVPSMVYTGTLMTETAFYPLFLLCALALVAVLERPTLGRIAALLVLTLLAFLTRAQAVAIVPAMVTAPLFLGRRRLREFRLLYAIVAAGALLVVLFEAVRGHTPLAVLGAYRASTASHYDAGDIFRWLVYHVGELDFYVGVAPFAALLLLLVTRERRTPFVAASVSLTGWLLLEVAAFASAQSQRIEERNMFFVAPLFFVALLVLVERGLPRTRAAAACAVVAAAFVGVVPYSGLINGNATSDTLALIPLWQLQDTVTTLDQVSTVVVFFAIAMALLLLLLPPRYAVALPVALVVLYAVALWPIESEPNGGIEHASIGALYGGTSKPDRDWIDAKLGHGAEVAALFDSNTMDKFTIWTNEFFNRSIRTVYDLHAPTPGSLPETPVSIDPRTGRIAGVTEPYVLTSRAVALDEPVVAADETKGLAVYRVTRPLAVTGVTAGIYGDSWSSPTPTYTRFHCRTGQTLLVTLADDPATGRARTFVSAGGRTSTVPAGGTRTIHVPLHAVAGRCVVHFSIRPAVQPSAVEPGSSDTRILGLRFLGFAVR